jgi:hypothetical protein
MLRLRDCSGHPCHLMVNESAPRSKAPVQIGDPIEVFRIAKDILSSRQYGIPDSGRSGIFEA